MNVKLQNILNEVCSEVLREAGEVQLGNGYVQNADGTISDELGNTGSREWFTSKGINVPQRAYNSRAAMADQFKKQELIANAAASNSGPIDREEEDGVPMTADGGSVLDKAEAMGNSAILHGKQLAGQLGQSISDHPYAWGAGALGALGAGAGALYLRKKLREAKARG